MTSSIPWAVPNIDACVPRSIERVFESGWFSSGPQVKQFEHEMAAYAGASGAVAVANGSLALELALIASNISPGDKVAVTSFSYAATAHAILRIGAIPIYVDICPRTFNIDPESLERCLKFGLKAVVFIDFAGIPAEYKKVSKLCTKHGLTVVHDAAQSLGSLEGGKPIVFRGNTSTTSFHAAKVLTTIEGGMVFSDDSETLDRIRALRSQGEDPNAKYRHLYIGTNARMTELQAALGIGQLENLASNIETRQQIAGEYLSRLGELKDITCMHSMKWLRERNIMFFPIKVPSEFRNNVKFRLAEAKIETRITYPTPLYELDSVRRAKGERTKICYPTAERASEEVLALPIHHRLSTRDIARVVDVIARSLRI